MTPAELQKEYHANVPKSTGDTGAAKAAPETPAAKPAPSNPVANPGTGNMTGQSYQTARTDAINQIYDAQREAREQEIKAAYDRNVSNAQAVADKIPGTYQTQANDLAVQYERNRWTLNQQAAGNGINTGTGSQQALALQSQWQRDYGGVKQAQADAQAEIDRKMLDLKTQYEGDIQSALAQNDYQKAAALLDEYNNSQEWNLKNAQILAEFGDFSGFGNLYGKEQADMMFGLWKAQNPDLAWNTGKMTAAEYEAMTGHAPFNSPGGGGTIADVINGLKNPSPSGGGGGGGSSWYQDAYNHLAQIGANAEDSRKYYDTMGKYA